MWVAVEDERKYAPNAAEALLRARMLSLPEFDSHVSKVCVRGGVKSLWPLRRCCVHACCPCLCVTRMY